MKNTLETRLGLFFALALIVAVIILEMIGAADFFRSGYRVTANFRNAQELKKGDLVKIAGVEIGRVEEVQLVNGQAQVRMKIQGQNEVHTDAKAAIKFTGLMGQNFVAIEGGSENAPRVQANATLETYEQPDLGTLMAKLENVAGGIESLTKSFSTDNLSGLLGPVTDFVKQNSGPLTAVISNVRRVSDQIAQGQGTVGKLIMEDSLYTAAFTTITNLENASGDIKGLASHADGLITNAQAVLEGLQRGEGTLGKLAKDETLYKETTTAMTNLREIMEKINRGQGSVGKLVNDESLFKNAKVTLQKLEKMTEGLEDQGPLSVLGIVANGLF